MRCSYNYWQFSENECAPFSKYIYEQKFEASILFFSLFLYLSCLSLFSVPFSAPLAPSSPLSPRLIFLGAVRIGSMARFRPPLETSHSTMPLVAPLDHDRPLRHCQPTLTSTVALLAKNQVRPGNWRSLIAVHHSFENPKLWKLAVFLFFFQQLDLLLRIEIVFMKSKSRYCVPSIETSLESYNLYDLAFQVSMIRMLKKLHGYARWYCRSFQVLKSSKENAQRRKSYVTAVNIL